MSRRISSRAARSAFLGAFCCVSSLACNFVSDNHPPAGIDGRYGGER